MSTRHKLGIWTLAAVFIWAGCGDDAGTTGPEDDGTLTAAEKSALIDAINATGALASSPAALYAPLVLGTIDEIGTISVNRTAAIDHAIDTGISLALSAAMASSYEGAVGIQVGFDVQGSTGWFIGLIGWNGLDTQTRTVSELVTVYAYGDGPTSPPPSVEDSFGGETLMGGAYWNGTSYQAMSGNVSISGSGFSGSTDCSVLVYSCSYATGTMRGSFGFMGQVVGSTDTYEQVPISFTNLPAVSLTVSDGG